MLYDNLLRLCNEKGVSLSRVCVENGINKSTATAWKKGGGITPATLKKLADYFGVTTSDLLGEKPVTITLLEGVGGPASSLKTKKDPDVLTDTEAKLVDLLMQLTPAEEQKVLAYIDGLLDNRAN